MAKTSKSMDEILDRDDSLSDDEIVRVEKAVAEQDGENFASIVQWLNDVAQWTGDEDMAKIAAILHAILKTGLRRYAYEKRPRVEKEQENLRQRSLRLQRIAMELLFIPIRERLPVEGDRVFVIQRSNTIGPGPQRAYRTSMEQGDSVPDFYWWLEADHTRLYDVTHWAEIPQIEEDNG